MPQRILPFPARDAPRIADRAALLLMQEGLARDVVVAAHYDGDNAFRVAEAAQKKKQLPPPAGYALQAWGWMGSLIEYGSVDVRSDGLLVRFPERVVPDTRADAIYRALAAY